MGRSKNEVRRREIVTDPRQDNLEVGACVAIHVCLNDGISTILEPSDAVGDDTCTSPPNANAWSPRGLVLASIDEKSITSNEVNDGIGRGHRAVGYSRETEPIRTRPAGQRVRIDPADQRVPSSATGKSIRACEP